MRRPARSLSWLLKARAVGARIAWEFNHFCKSCPAALEVGTCFGNPSFAGAPDEGALLEAWLHEAGDPEAQFIKSWVYDGVPLGRA
eukprot:5123524-Amphidinium_carterae.1